MFEFQTHIPNTKIYIYSDGTKQLSVTAESRESADAIASAWTEPAPEPTVKTYSKLSIIRVINQIGKYEEFSSFIGALSPYQRDCWSAAQVVRTDDAEFGALLSAVPMALGVSAEQVAELLAACEVEG